MKIGYYIQHFPYKERLNDSQYYKQYAYGGAEVVAYNLAVNMAKRGHEISVFTTSIDHKDTIEKKENMVIYRYAKNFKVGRSNISMGLFYKPERYPLDVIHAHLSVKIDGLAALLHAKRRKIPLIVTHHGDTYKYKHGGYIHKSGIVSFLNGHITERVLSRAKVIISPTEHYINESRFLGKYKEKIVVIPNGINLDDFMVPYSKKECRIRLGLPINKNIILFVGKLIDYKGPDILMKAMVHVIKKIPGTNVVFVGNGKMIKGLDELAKKSNIENYIKFTGFVKESVKPFYYKSADIFTFPSVQGPDIFGITNLEAMALGLPIIASKIGGIPDIVRDAENGLLVPPGDSEALADAIIYLLENKDVMEKIGKNGREKVEDYSWERIAEETEKVYLSLTE